MGTVVTKRQRQGMFDRKLKMMRIGMFALLAVCQCRLIFEDQDSVKDFKSGVHTYLQRDTQDLLEEIGVEKKVRGWSHVIHDMTLRNELTDVRVINRPDYSAYNVEAEDWFSYATFLKPGYHQFIIYDPALDRAFCQDFVAKLN